MIEHATERIHQAKNWSKEELIKTLNDLITGWGFISQLWMSATCLYHVRRKNI